MFDSASFLQSPLASKTLQFVPCIYTHIITLMIMSVCNSDNREQTKAIGISSKSIENNFTFAL